MSLINQMLRDLEQRRVTEAGVSPLGGLSASGAVSPRPSMSINYLTLMVLLAVSVAVGVVLTYVLNEQREAKPVADQTKDDVNNRSLQGVMSEKPIEASVIMKRSQATAGEKPAVVEGENRQRKSRQDEAKSTRRSASLASLASPETPDKASPKTALQKLVPAQSENTGGAMMVTPAGAQNRNLGTPESARAATQTSINKTIRPLTGEQRAQLAFQRAVTLLGEGNAAAAKAVLEDALAFAPRHVQVRETLVALLLNTGRTSEAANRLRDGLQLAPDATPLARLYARILVDQGDVDAAVSVLERARPAVFADPEYYALLAALYRQQQKHAQAAQIYQRILMQRPGVAAWWMGLALAQDAMGEGAAALKAYQRARRAGGLPAEVVDYVQARIVALTPVETAPMADAAASDVDAFEE